MNCTTTKSLSNENSIIDDHKSQFGDGYSVKSRNHVFAAEAQPDDQPEKNYDQGATNLYRAIENKQWDVALNRLETSPVDAKTWVYRQESDGKIRWRLLPLHAVCIFRAPLALIEALMEVYPEASKQKDDQGMLPIHLACRNGASKGVILSLLSAYPESLEVRDRKGRSPFDFVQASSSANKQSVLDALNKFKQDIPAVTTAPTSKSDASGPHRAHVLHEVDYEHRTILFRMILKKDWKQVVARASTFPEEAATWICTKGFNGKLRFLPIHKACVLNPPAEVLTALNKSYPEGAYAADQDGWLPIHCACFYGANKSVVTELLEAFPKGAVQKDDDGRLPLHYACLKGASQDVVDVLLEAHSKTAMNKDDEGRLPIHHACSKGAPETVIDSLLKAAPKSAQSKDDQGRLPLHHACRKNASERVIRTLLRVYPRAAQVKDDQDKLPIHYSCQYGASAAIVNFLLTTYPESINVKNGFGYTPLAEAKASERPNKEPVIKVLEKFKKQNGSTTATGDVSAMADDMALLEERIAFLEKSLSKVADLGTTLNKDIKKGKDPYDILQKLGDKMIALGGGKTSSKSTTPLKVRQSTPSRGLFVRRKSTAAAM